MATLEEFSSRKRQHQDERSVKEQSNATPGSSSTKDADSTMLTTATRTLIE